MPHRAHQIRRATVDDLGALVPMWNAMRLPAGDLEKRLREFQVAVDAEGRLAGAIGFQMAGRQGCLHSEAFVDFALADRLRALFWERIKILAANHGILRVWTQEEAPFWARQGFQNPDANDQKKFPTAWANENRAWRTLQLKDEETIQSMEKEVAALMESERRRTAEIFRRADTLKSIVVWALIAMFGACIAFLFFYVLRKNPDALRFGR